MAPTKRRRRRDADGATRTLTRKTLPVQIYDAHQYAFSDKISHSDILKKGVYVTKKGSHSALYKNGGAWYLGISVSLGGFPVSRYLFKLVGVRSRLYQHRFLQVNTHFAGFFEIYTIAKLNFQNFADFHIIFQNFAEIFGFLQNFLEFSANR